MNKLLTAGIIILLAGFLIPGILGYISCLLGGFLVGFCLSERFIK